MAQAPIQMPDYMGAARIKIAQRQQAMGEMDRIIQQYKLDAENERRVAGGALATLGAEMENNPDGVNSLAQSNPEFGKALKLLNEGKAKKKDMQIISASLAANTQARAQKLQEDNLLARTDAQKFENAFNKRTEELDVVAKELANDGQRLINRINGYKERMAEIESQYKDITTNMEYSRVKAQYDLAVEQLDNLKRYGKVFTPEMNAQLDFLTKQLAAAGQPATPEAGLANFRKQIDEELKRPFREGTLREHVDGFNPETGEIILTVDRSDLTEAQLSQVIRLESLRRQEFEFLSNTTVPVVGKDGKVHYVTIAEKNKAMREELEKRKKEAEEQKKQRQFAPSVEQGRPSEGGYGTGVAP